MHGLLIELYLAVGDLIESWGLSQFNRSVDYGSHGTQLEHTVVVEVVAMFSNDLEFWFKCKIWMKIGETKFVKCCCMSRVEN